MAIMVEKKRSRQPEAARIDDRGRISLPKGIRKQMDIEAGDIVFMVWKGGQLEIRKAMNPFDVLAEKAIQEYEEGKTKKIDDLAAELGIDLDENECTK